MAQTQAQINASKKYHTKLDNISFRVPKGQKEQLQEHAQSMGESLNGFLSRAVTETMERDIPSK